MKALLFDDRPLLRRLPWIVRFARAGWRGGGLLGADARAVALDRGPRLTVRILFASHYALPHLGGIEVVVDALAPRAGAARARGLPRRLDRPPCRRAARQRDPAEYRLVRVPALNAAEARLGVPYPLFSPALLPCSAPRGGDRRRGPRPRLLDQPSAAALSMARRSPSQPVRAATEHVGHVHYDSRLLDSAQGAAFATIGR